MTIDDGICDVLPYSNNCNEVRAMLKHDKEVYNTAIDDFAKLVEIWCWKHEQYNQDDLNKLMNIAEQLKAGGENERSI